MLKATLLSLFLVTLVGLPGGFCFMNTRIPRFATQPASTRVSRGLRGLRATAGPSLDRRAIVAGLIGSFGLSAIPPAGAEVIGAPPTGVSLAQGDLQAALSPGHWVGQLIGINSHSEKWKLSATPEECAMALKEALENITPQERRRLLFEHIDIKEVSAQKVKVLTWTKSEWLDVLEVAFKALPDGSGTEANVSIYATGFLPTSIPLAPIINTALFFFPFASPNPVAGGMLQVTRSADLYKMITSRLSQK